MSEKKFVLWGHGLKEYKEMFALSDEDLAGPILEFGAGASSFNEELTAKGSSVVSLDSLYQKNETDLKTKIDATFNQTLAKIKANEEAYSLRSQQTLDKLQATREAGIARFMKDFAKGLDEKRYQSFKGLPLPFENYSFKLALVCHHLFVNHESQDIESHLALIRELVRVAGEVRIFPLIDKYGQTSNLLGPVLLALQQEDEVASEVKEVPSQIQPTGNAMLRVWTLKCDMA